MDAFFSITLTLFFVIDALGHIPAYLRLLKPYDKRKRRRIAIRELLWALVIMVLFNFLGPWLLTLLDINSCTVQLAGGIVLFLIAVRLIFSSENGETKWKEQEPFIVPLATPLIAGPAVLSIIMIFAQQATSIWVMLGAIFTAWFVSSILFLLAEPIYKLVKDKGLNACQRLMGLIVALIAVQLFLQGIVGVIK